MPSRRDALKQLAGFAALGTLAPLASCAGSGGDGASAAADSSGAAAKGASPVANAAVPGVQLYTVRSEMEKDVEATLARVAQIGYKEVEFAGYFGRPASDIAAMLQRIGLTSPSAHVPITDLRGKLDAVLDDAATVGHRYIVCPWLPEEERGDSVDKWKKLAAELNKAADGAEKRGIGFAYHNHDFEFTPVGDTNGMQVLLAECDPKLVKIELDLYWATKARQDPTALFAAHPGRFPLVHVKDMAADGSFAEVGTGTIDFRRIFAQARQGGIEHFYVENDQPKDAFGSITQSIAGLRAIPVGS